MLDFLLYYLKLLVGSIGLLVVCGLLVHLISRLFARLIGGSGSRTWYYITSVIGTPVHELGHAIMCKLFFHRITGMKLWIPKPTNGVYGYVEHSYSKRNWWAKFGNLFIGMGPLFSGLGVTVLALWLCFPTLWSDYLATTSAMLPSGDTILPFSEVFSSVFLLIREIPAAVQADWLRSSVGLLVILSVALHVSLSPQDVKGSMGAVPIYLILVLIAALATYWTSVASNILSTMLLLNLRLFSLFALVIGFALVWLAFSALVRLVRIIISLF